MTHSHTLKREVSKNKICSGCGLLLTESPSENCWYCYNSSCDLYGKHLRKADDWLKTEGFDKYTILDPDGWDRKNYEVSWNELITKEEMRNRLLKSTIQGKGGNSSQD